MSNFAKISAKIKITSTRPKSATVNIMTFDDILLIPKIRGKSNQPYQFHNQIQRNKNLRHYTQHAGTKLFLCTTSFDSFSREIDLARPHKFTLLFIIFIKPTWALHHYKVNFTLKSTFGLDILVLCKSAFCWNLSGCC